MFNIISSNELAGLGVVRFSEKLQIQGKPRDVLTLDEGIAHLS